jgi:ribosomal protein S18 acetylase RimI-like enzyme
MNDAGVIVDLTIRDAELGDAVALADLMCELGYKTSSDEMEARLRPVLADSGFKTLVAVLDGRLCGMIGTLAHASHEHNDPSGRIIALVVLKSMRRRGIARQLIAAAENDFSARKITRIALTTRLTRENAHRFYQELGYVRNGFRYAKDLTSTKN